MAVIAGILLAGGQSRRMGTDKTQLVFEGKTLLARALDALRPHCGPVFVVVGALGALRSDSLCSDAARAAAGAEPGLRQKVRVLRDGEPGQGPLRGLATGLAAAEELGCEHAAVLSSDLPLITAAAVGELLRAAEAGPAEAVLAEDGTRTHPLVGVYATALAGPAREALARGDRAVLRFLAARSLRKQQLSDPSVLSNVNTPQEWAAVAGLRSEP